MAKSLDASITGVMGSIKAILLLMVKHDGCGIFELDADGVQGDSTFQQYVETYQYLAGYIGLDHVIAATSNSGESFSNSEEWCETDSPARFKALFGKSSMEKAKVLWTSRYLVPWLSRLLYTWQNVLKPFSKMIFPFSLFKAVLIACVEYMQGVENFFTTWASVLMGWWKGDLSMPAALSKLLFGFVRAFLPWVIDPIWFFRSVWSGQDPGFSRINDEANYFQEASSWKQFFGNIIRLCIFTPWMAQTRLFIGPDQRGTKLKPFSSGEWLSCASAVLKAALGGGFLWFFGVHFLIYCVIFPTVLLAEGTVLGPWVIVCMMRDMLADCNLLGYAFCCFFFTIYFLVMNITDTPSHLSISTILGYVVVALLVSGTVLMSIAYWPEIVCYTPMFAPFVLLGLCIPDLILGSVHLFYGVVFLFRKIFQCVFKANIRDKNSPMASATFPVEPEVIDVSPDNRVGENKHNSENTKCDTEQKSSVYDID